MSWAFFFFFFFNALCIASVSSHGWRSNISTQHLLTNCPPTYISNLPTVATFVPCPNSYVTALPSPTTYFLDDLLHSFGHIYPPSY